MKVGFIGLGIMGTPMAEKLIAGGYQLYANTLNKVPPELVEKGAIACATPKQVAEQADVIFIMVPDTPQVEEVLFAANGCAEAPLKTRSWWI